MPIQSFQERTLNQIVANIEEYGLEVSQQQAWANTGNLYAHRPGETTPAMTIRYNFQSGSYTLSITVGEKKIPSQVGRADYFDFHHDPVTSVTRFWGCLIAELAKLTLEHRSDMIAEGMDARERRHGRVR